MSLAWETTIDDVRVVLKQIGKKATPKQVKAIYDDLDADEIESAALHGDEISEQTDYAFKEIHRQIKAMPVYKELGGRK